MPPNGFDMKDMKFAFKVDVKGDTLDKDVRLRGLPQAETDHAYTLLTALRIQPTRK